MYLAATSTAVQIQSS